MKQRRQLHTEMKKTIKEFKQIKICGSQNVTLLMRAGPRSHGEETMSRHYDGGWREGDETRSQAAINIHPEPGLSSAISMQITPGETVSQSGASIQVS